MQYGWITPKDWEIIQASIDNVLDTYKSGTINTVEVGVRDGKTSKAIHGYLTKLGRINFYTGIDNCRDMPVAPPFTSCNLLIGNSIEVYTELPENSQHFGFIDGCHNYPMTMADFLVYSDKIKVGGVICLHDCGPHIPEKKDWQGMGSKDHPDMYISCRKAVKKLGLLGNKFPGWELIFDEWDETYDYGGVVAVKRIF